MKGWDFVKKFLVYLTMILCYFASNWFCKILNLISANVENLQAVALVLTILFSVAFAFLSFYGSQKILKSEKGLRYKVLSIFTIIVGFTTGVSALTTVYENAELFDIFVNPDMLVLFLVSLINPTFIFGITLFVLHKKNYKKDLTNRL